MTTILSMNNDYDQNNNNLTIRNANQGFLSCSIRFQSADIYAICSVPRRFRPPLSPTPPWEKKPLPSIPVGYPSDQKCQQLRKPQNFTKFHAITDENAIKFNFDVGDAVHSGFTYRTFWEAMLPSLGIAWIPCTNYNIQGRNLQWINPWRKFWVFTLPHLPTLCQKDGLQLGRQSLHNFPGWL